MANSSSSHEIDWVMKCHKKITYNVDNVGTIIEEMKVSTKKLPDGRQEDSEAIYNVYINQELVRQKNIVTGEIIKSNPKYEPYSFLRGFNTDPIPDVQAGSYINMQTLIEEIQKESGKTKN